MKKYILALTFFCGLLKAIAMEPSQEKNNLLKHVNPPSEEKVSNFVPFLGWPKPICLIIIELIIERPGKIFPYFTQYEQQRWKDLRLVSKKTRDLADLFILERNPYTATLASYNYFDLRSYVGSKSLTTKKIMSLDYGLKVLRYYTLSQNRKPKNPFIIEPGECKDIIDIKATKLHRFTQEAVLYRIIYKPQELKWDEKASPFDWVKRRLYIFEHEDDLNDINNIKNGLGWSAHDLQNMIKLNIQNKNTDIAFDLCQILYDLALFDNDLLTKEHLMFMKKHMIAKLHQGPKQFLSLLSLKSRNHPLALLEFGICYRKGIGVKKNLKKAYSLLEKIIIQPNAEALYHLARIDEEREGRVKIKNFTQAAQMGHVKSMLKVALYELLDLPQPIADYDLSFNYLKQASHLGDAKASYYLGYSYLHGKGTVVDYNKAFEAFIISANDGFYKAHSGAGALYLLKKNYKKAFEHLQEAAKFGDGEAFYLLSYMYRNGYYVEKNINSVENYIILAAEKGEPRALNEIKEFEKDNQPKKSCTIF